MQNNSRLADLLRAVADFISGDGGEFGRGHPANHRF